MVQKFVAEAGRYIVDVHGVYRCTARVDAHGIVDMRGETLQESVKRVKLKPANCILVLPAATDSEPQTESAGVQPQPAPSCETHAAANDAAHGAAELATARAAGQGTMSSPDGEAAREPEHDPHYDDDL